MTRGIQWARDRDWAVFVLLVALGMPIGCTRTLYRRQADREAHYLVREKSVSTPWEVPRRFTIQPDPRSRFFDPTDPDHPTLPPAGPRLYAYELPDLSNRRDTEQLEPLPAIPPNGLPDAPAGQPELPPPPQLPELQSVPLPPAEIPGTAPHGSSPRSAQLNGRASGETPHAIQLASFQQGPGAPPAAQQATTDPFMLFINTLSRARVKIKGLEVQPVGMKYWEEIPANCLALMLEFESVRTEYVETFGRKPDEQLRDRDTRVTQRELFELALINSREYQRQKEILYQAALDVALERFFYATKFSLRGSTVDTTYTHSRVAGTTVNSLAVPSTFAGDKVLATGGTLVGQFANDILLTFNGPAGFAADVSSELLLEITQRVVRRDILLEPLIQSERDLVYAARGFARYRKEFFLQVTEAYYGILRDYRRIEISAQNYFAQVRNLQQALEEVESGVSTAPNVIFLNQYERSVLQALADLIVVCNRLAQTLDDTKVIIGIPTETLINVVLDELEQLTLRDTIEVSRAQASRWLKRLEKLRSEASETNHGDILTADYSLSERLIKWLWERGKIAKNTVDTRETFNERAKFRLDAARLDLLSERRLLATAQTADPPKQRILVFQLQVEVIEAELLFIARQLDFGEATAVQHTSLEQDRKQWQSLGLEFESLLEALDEALETNPDDQDIIDLIDEATALLAKIETLSQNLDELLFGRQIDRVELQATLERTDRLVELTKAAFADAGGGLPPIDISVDEAMITALVQRLDLMNERGILADRWRSIKLAADELKSNLSLTARQRIGTDTNRPFSFSTDNADTRLRLAWDLPLNRKRERNIFRRSLIDYNVGLRDLMLAEDVIKLNVRRQMRNLAQARAQYPIFVTQAALAEEQVISTRLQLILGIPGVRAPDLLDAYNAARNALADMVDARIGYITERARFALELEVMMLDDTGYWPEINDPKYQPEPNGAYPWNAGSAYGTFPSYLRVSHELRRMLNCPPPGASPQMLPPGAPPQLEELPQAEANAP